MFIRLASQYGRYGYRRITALLRAEGWQVNVKRIQRIVEAGNDYKLITVSDSGKSQPKRFFVGSVAFDIIAAAARSVLNVR